MIKLRFQVNDHLAWLWDTISFLPAQCSNVLPDSKFNRDAPNVVHMTVKPQDIVDEEDAKATKGIHSRNQEDSDRSPGCRCVIL